MTGAKNSFLCLQHGNVPLKQINITLQMLYKAGVHVPRSHLKYIVCVVNTKFAEQGIVHFIAPLGCIVSPGTYQSSLICKF